MSAEHWSIETHAIQDEYKDFLDDRTTYNRNATNIERMINERKTRLIVDVDYLRQQSKDRAASLIQKDATIELFALRLALKRQVTLINPQFGSENEFFVSLCGHLGASRHVSPQQVTSQLLNNIISLEGSVVRATRSRPQLFRAVQYCSNTKKFHTIGGTSVTFPYLTRPVNVRNTDDDNYPLQLEQGLSKYIDFQQVTVQDSPESSPVGLIGRKIEAFLYGDLVDTCKPGDRVQIVGNFIGLPSVSGGFTNCIMNARVVANNVFVRDKKIGRILTDQTTNAIMRTSKNSDTFVRLAESLAPTICKRSSEKQGALAALIGGNEIILPNKSRIRGDIHTLYIGDPSVSKSLLLREVFKVAECAISTTGRGSTGVGLTAAVLKDNSTGTYFLEAGATVLADRGFLCVDEFDKMSDIDRTSMHEIMEQGRFSINKAGINVRLNTRVSIIAAANFSEGYYNHNMTPQDNINLQDTVLSRFDLVFVMFDQPDWDIDGLVADHVLRAHRYRPANSIDTPSSVNAVDCVVQDSTKSNSEDIKMYLADNDFKYDGKSLFSSDFVQAYLHVARQVRPILSRDAETIIVECYKLLRRQELPEDLTHTTPITLRSLESMFRLAAAHAKARLSLSVDKEDASFAVDLFQKTCIQKFPKKSRSQRRKRQSELIEEKWQALNDDGSPTQLSVNQRVEGIRIPTDQELESVKDKLPLIKEIITKISRQNHGAMTIDIDLIIPEATEGEITRHEVDMLLFALEKEDFLCKDETSIYLTTD